MRHSDKTKTVLMRILKAVAFLSIFVAINSAICYYLSPSAHKSNEMWDYYFATEDADTLIVGTSVAEMIREFEIDEYTGRRCINMGTPSQYFATSAQVIETATKQRPIDTVVLLMGFDALERAEDPTATLSIEKAYYDNEKMLGKLFGFLSKNLRYSFTMRNIATSDSINKWMSWPVNCTVYFDQIKANLEKKEYYLNLRKSQNIPMPGEIVNRYDRTSFPRVRNVGDEVRDQIAGITQVDVSKDSVAVLKQIGEYCVTNGITFIVAISPHRSDYASTFGNDYEKLDRLTRECVESMGCVYVNMNDNESVRNLMTDDYYTDLEHVTNDGIDVASGILSEILNLLTGKRN